MRPPTPSEFGFSVAGKRKRSPEFPCVSRFRKRRLISFLSHHKFFRTADVLVTQTDVFLCLKHLAELVDAGSWDKAIDYLSRFLPSDRPLGIHGRALFHFLRVHKAIDDVLAGAPEARSVTTALDQCFIRHPTKSHAITRLRAIFSSLLCSKRYRLPSLTSDDHSQGLTRESLIKAKEWLVDLVEISLEAGKMSEAELTQSASNKGGPVTPVSRTNLATFKAVTYRTLFRKAKEWMVYFTEECLKAWPDASQDDLPQLFCKDGDPDGTVSHTVPGSLTSLAENSAIASVKKPDALFSQTMLGTLTNPAEDSGMSSVTNAGAYKPLSEEYFSSSRKNPRMKLATIRQGFDPKRRRTTLTSQIETGTEDQQAT